MRLKPLSEQVVVVMGASTGIGRLTALELAERGARVAVSARAPEALESLAAEIRAAGGQALAVPADASRPEEVQTVADATERAFGGLDTWINMAAVSTYAPFAKLTAEEWPRIIEIDLMGYVNGARTALPALKRRHGGAIINVSSVEGRVAMPSTTPAQSWAFGQNPSRRCIPQSASSAPSSTRQNIRCAISLWAAAAAS